MINNFKNLKSEFEKSLLESVLNNNSETKNKWQTTKKMIQKSKILKSLYLVYENINKCDLKDKDTIELFLKENLSLFNKFSKKDIIKECTLLKEHLGVDDTECADNLFKLIIESTNDSKISEVKNKTLLLKEMVKTINDNNQKNSLEVESEVLSMDECKNKLAEIAEKYSFLNEKENSVLNAFLLNDPIKKEKVFNDLKNDNINFIKRTLYESDELDNEIITMLKESEIKLKNMIFTEESKIEDFIKLLDFNK